MLIPKLCLFCSLVLIYTIIIVLLNFTTIQRLQRFPLNEDTYTLFDHNKVACIKIQAAVEIQLRLPMVCFYVVMQNIFLMNIYIKLN